MVTERQPFEFAGRGQSKCAGTRAETRFRVHLNRPGRGASVQSTTGSRGVRISGTNAGYTVFRGRVKSTGYPLHSPVSPSLSLPCVTVCHHISTGVCNCFRFLFVWLNAERSLEKNCCLAFCMLLCAWRKVKTNSGEELTIFARELQSGLSLALGYSNICCLKLKVIYFSLLPFTVLRCVIPFVCLNYKMR